VDAFYQLSVRSRGHQKHDCSPFCFIAKLRPIHNIPTQGSSTIRRPYLNLFIRQWQAPAFSPRLPHQLGLTRKLVLPSTREKGACVCRTSLCAVWRLTWTTRHSSIFHIAACISCIPGSIVKCDYFTDSTLHARPMDT
jgi:hypothetical protein